MEGFNTLSGIRGFGRGVGGGGLDVFRFRFNTLSGIRGFGRTNNLSSR